MGEVTKGIWCWALHEKHLPWIMPTHSTKALQEQSKVPCLLDRDLSWSWCGGCCTARGSFANGQELLEKGGVPVECSSGLGAVDGPSPVLPSPSLPLCCSPREHCVIPKRHTVESSLWHPQGMALRPHVPYNVRCRSMV